MIILIFEDEKAQAEALQLNWTYANKVERTPYKEVTDALDKFN